MLDLSKQINRLRNLDKFVREKNTTTVTAVNDRKSYVLKQIKIIQDYLYSGKKVACQNPQLNKIKFQKTKKSPLWKLEVKFVMSEFRGNNWLGSKRQRPLCMIWEILPYKWTHGRLTSINLALYLNAVIFYILYSHFNYKMSTKKHIHWNTNSLLYNIIRTQCHSFRTKVPYFASLNQNKMKDNSSTYVAKLYCVNNVQKRVIHNAQTWWKCLSNINSEKAFRVVKFTNKIMWKTLIYCRIYTYKPERCHLKSQIQKKTNCLFSFIVSTFIL